MKQKNKKKSKAVIIFFILLFLFGLCKIKDVGYYNDELTEQDILRMNIREYAEFVSHDNDLVRYYNSKNIQSISDSIEKDHGISAYYIFAPTLLIGVFSEKYLGILWHTYTYMLYFLGVIMFYLILNHLFKNKKISCLGTAIYFFSPRIFADGLYNNKDIVLLSLCLCTIYYGIRFIEDKTFKSAIIFGLVAAFAANTKIVGIFVFGMVGLYYLIHYIVLCIKNKKFQKKELFVGLTAIIIMLCTYTIITPAIWGNGHLDFIGYLDWCIKNSTKFSRWNGSVLFDGKHFNYSLGQTLPWYYLPKMIIITTPIYILLFFIVGIIYIIYNIIKNKDRKEALHFSMIFFTLMIPLTLALVTHTKLYNGWRHFYFTYGLIVLISVYGIYYFGKTIKRKKTFYLTIISIVFFYFIGISIYGVTGTAYFNILVNHKDLREIYELDYYGVCGKPIMEEALANKKQNKIYIYSEQYSYNIIESSYFKLSGVDKEHLEYINDYDKYRKLKEENKEVYIYYNSSYNDKKLVKNLKKIYYKNGWGNDVGALYR